MCSQHFNRLEEAGKGSDFRWIDRKRRAILFEGGAQRISCDSRKTDAQLRVGILKRVLWPAIRGLIYTFTFRKCECGCLGNVYVHVDHAVMSSREFLLNSTALTIKNRYQWEEKLISSYNAPQQQNNNNVPQQQNNNNVPLGEGGGIRRGIS